MAILDHLPRQFRRSDHVSAVGRRLQRRHVLMLALAIEVLFVGFANAGRYRPPGIVVEQTLDRAHIIT